MFTQEIDHLFSAKYGSVFPLQTNDPKMPEYSVDKFNLTMYYAPFFQNDCAIPCQSMRIYFAGYDGTNESDNDKQAYIRFYIKDQEPKHLRLYNNITCKSLP